MKKVATFTSFLCTLVLYGQVERLFESTGPPAYSPLFQLVRLGLEARGPSAAAREDLP